MNTATITIPKKLAKNENLIVIPQKEYDAFLEFKKIIRVVKPAKLELKAIKRGRQEIKNGKYILWHELKRKLASHSF